jgi:UDP-N-acetylmuramoylalanine--D-glutamate ligase
VSGAFGGQRAVVIGLGVSGRAAARVLLDEGAEVLVTEARPIQELEVETVQASPGRYETGATPLALDGSEPGLQVRAGGHRPEHLDGATLVVVSPGVPPATPVLTWARERELPIWSELELGARMCRAPVVAVTGTNGKTTTVQLVTSMLRESGLHARGCGNVGFPFSLAAREPVDVLVVEASSFQLAFHESLHPRVSVLLNMAPDHLDWHGSFPAYAAAKARIYARQGPEDVHVGNHDDAEAARISRRAPCEVRWFRWGPPDEEEVGVTDGEVVARTAADGDVATRDLRLGSLAGSSRALLLDAAAASAAALAFGVPAKAIEAALQNFEPLPHRGSVVARAGSIEFVDDSKATNPHAALAALEGRSGVVLIAGGLAKGVDLSPLAQAVPALSGVVAIGEAAPALEAVFRGLVPIQTAGSIDEAVQAAFGLSEPGGTVLLAPACASQDMFRDYRERGERFAAASRLVAARVAGRHEAHPSPSEGAHPPLPVVSERGETRA